jgi:hypothetical protein
MATTTAVQPEWMKVETCWFKGNIPPIAGRDGPLIAIGIEGSANKIGVGKAMLHKKMHLPISSH